MAAAGTKLFSICSLLMAFLFAYSASVQLNDHDWYFWFPLYSCACVVNLVNCVSSSRAMRLVAKLGLWLGIFLFIKVLAEDYVQGIAGFWSLDLSERVVREKTGSGLVVFSMFLHLEASLIRNNNCSTIKKPQIPRYIKYGMAILVGISYGLPLVFFRVQKGELKF